VRRTPSTAGAARAGGTPVAGQSSDPDHLSPPPDGEPPSKQGERPVRVARAMEIGKSADGLSVGIRMVVCIGLGAVGGWWIDQRLGTETPWATIVGFFLGTAAAFKGLFAMAMPKQGPRGR